MSRHASTSRTVLAATAFKVPSRGPADAAFKVPSRGPADAAFKDFLRSHAVVLTPPARAYLAGLSQAGPGELPLPQRREAAMRTILAVGGEAADLLTADTGPLPDHMAWIDLLDVATLEEFLTATEPDQPR